jgi:N-acetylmuramoyl-L-alanine amidase
MNSGRKPIRKRVLTWMIALLLSCSLPLPVFAAHDGAVIEHVSVTLDGEKVLLEDPVRMLEGRLFFPVAGLASLFDATVEWDQDNEAMTIHTANADKIVMSNGVPVAYLNDTRYQMDVAPFITNGRTYIPIRYAAGFMSATVMWHPDEKVAEFISLESTEDEVASIFSVAEPFAEEDLLLLAKLVQVEAGYESYEGQLAVANVIMNRVKDSRFPNTIYDVIYSGRQFPPAHNGLLDKSEPNESVLRATKDTLDGKNNVDDAVYFFNPDAVSGSFWDRLEVVAKIGNHSFAK